MEKTQKYLKWKYFKGSTENRDFNLSGFRTKPGS